MTVRHAAKERFSYANLSACQDGDLQNAVLKEAVHNAVNQRFPSFLCLLALSTVVRHPIIAYCSGANDQRDESTSRKDSLFRLFNCTVYPRDMHQADQEKLQIFHCAAMPLDYLQIAQIPKENNHFVPLLGCLEKSSDNTCTPATRCRKTPPKRKLV